MNMWYIIIFTDDCSESCSTKPGVCDADAEPELADQKVWNKKDTQTLFDVRRKKEKDFNSNKVHKALWDIIVKELAAVGVTATATQCMNKWKALKREYKKTMDHNAQTRSDKKLCPFYEEFGELYGHKSGTRPTYTMSSRMKLNEEKQNVYEEEYDSKDSNSSSECCTPHQKKRPLKRKINTQSAVLALEEYSKKQEEYRKERLEVSRKQHEEKMNLMEKLIKCFQPKADQ